MADDSNPRTGLGDRSGPLAARRPGRVRAGLRDLGLLGPAYLIPGLASFLTIPILFRVLGSAEYGRWALLYGIAAGVPQVTTSWLEARLVRFSYLEPGHADRFRYALAIGGSIVISAPLALLVLPKATFVEVVAAAVLTAAVSRYLLALARLQSAMRFGAVSVAAATRSILGALLGILGAVAIGSAGAAIAGLGAGYLVGEGAAAVWVTVRPAGKGARAPSAGGAGSTETTPVDISAARLRYEVASGANAVAQYELQVGDRFILSARRPLGDVGVYTATYALVDLAGRFLPAIVLGAVRPRVFRAWDANRPELASRLVLRLAGVVSWMVGAAVAALVLISTAVPQLPVDRTLAGPIGFGFACFVAANTIGLVYSAAARQGRLAAHAVVAAATNVAMNLAFVSSFGPQGAAVATAGSYALLFVANVSGLRDGNVDGASLLAIASSLAALALISLSQADVGPAMALAGAGGALLIGLAAVVVLVGRILNEE